MAVSAMPASAVLAGGEFGDTPEKACENYAANAIYQVNYAVVARCGFSGPRWTPDKEQHRSWCLGFKGDQTAPLAEYHARDQQIRDCFARCIAYAEEAVKDVTKAEQLKCGFTGPRWDEDDTEHKAWCQVRAAPGAASAETAARKAAIEGCMRNHPNPAAPAPTQVIPTPAPKSSTGGAGSAPCDPPHIRYKNGECGCPSGLTGANCDEIVVH